MSKGDEYITPNFKRKEFACKCGCGLMAIDEGAVHRLQVVRDIARIPIKINSGCRCPKHNANEGGKPESYHLPKEDGLCKAIDWCFVGNGDSLLEKMCLKLLDNWSGGFHYYPKRTLPNGKVQEAFCHSDTGPRRRW